MKCLLCQSEKQKVFTQVESFGFPLVYYQCENCGLIFQSAEESRASGPDFYAQTYRKIYQSSAEPTTKDLWVQEQRASHLVGLLRIFHLDQPERILDIGASTGVLLQSFQQAFDSEVVGVEPGDAYRAYAERHGLVMFPSLDSLIEGDTEKFDLVSLIHVLEHLPDPVAYLRQVRQQVLSEQGILLLEVPNFYAHDSYELAHLACFTPHTLREVVKQAGFRVVFSYGHGGPRSSRLSLFLTLIAQALPEGSEIPAVRPDRLVRLKRQIGFLYRRFMQKLFPHKAWLPLPEEES